MAFLELADLKTLMRIPGADTTRDAELTMYVDAANAHLYAIFGGLEDSAPTEYVDKITVDDVSTFGVWTRRWPVLDSPVPELVEDGSTVDGADYSINDMGLVRLLGRARYFAHGPEVLEVTYTAGFAGGDPQLAELKLIAAQIAMFNVNTAPRGGLEQERIGQYSYKLADGAAGGGEGAGGFGIPAAAERALAKWTATLRGYPNAA